MRIIKTIVLFSLFSFLLFCENASEDQEESLYVKFENSSESSFTITSIEMMLMGESGQETPSPSGKWIGNLLRQDEQIAPGSHVFFDLEIPNRHYAQYRLAVLDENENEVFIHQQAGYPAGGMQGTITHWGSDERSVIATVQRNQNTNRIQVVGYSDFAGID